MKYIVKKIPSTHKCVQTSSLVLYTTDVYKVMVSMQYVTNPSVMKSLKNLENDVRYLIVYRHSFWTMFFEIFVFLLFFLCNLYVLSFLFLYYFKVNAYKLSLWQWDESKLISYLDFIYNHWSTMEATLSCNVQHVARKISVSWSYKCVQ